MTVFTTVTDKGQEPVTVTSVAHTEGGFTMSGIELRKAGNRSEVRALTSDEIKQLSDLKVSPKKTAVRSSAKPTRGAAVMNSATPRIGGSQLRKTRR